MKRSRRACTGRRGPGGRVRCAGAWRVIGDQVDDMDLGSGLQGSLADPKHAAQGKSRRAVNDRERVGGWKKDRERVGGW